MNGKPARRFGPVEIRWCQGSLAAKNLPTSRTNAWFLGNFASQCMSFTISQNRFGKADQRAIMYCMVFARTPSGSKAQCLPVPSPP